MAIFVYVHTPVSPAVNDAKRCGCIRMMVSASCKQHKLLALVCRGDRRTFCLLLQYLPSCVLLSYLGRKAMFCCSPSLFRSFFLSLSLSCSHIAALSTIFVSCCCCCFNLFTRLRKAPFLGQDHLIYLECYPNLKWLIPGEQGRYQASRNTTYYC